MLPLIVSIIVGAAFWYGAQYGPGLEWVLAVLAFGFTYQTMQNEKSLREVKKQLQEQAKQLAAKESDSKKT